MCNNNNDSNNKSCIAEILCVIITMIQIIKVVLLKY